MKDLRNKYSGFTLVEIVIAMAILSVILVAASRFLKSGLNSFSNNSTQVKLQNEVEEIINILEEIILEADEVGTEDADSDGLNEILYVTTDETKYKIYLSEGDLYYSYTESGSETARSAVYVGTFVDTVNFTLDTDDSESVTAVIMALEMTYQQTDYSANRKFMLRNKVGSYATVSVEPESTAQAETTAAPTESTAAPTETESSSDSVIDDSDPKINIQATSVSANLTSGKYNVTVDLKNAGDDADWNDIKISYYYITPTDKDEMTVVSAAVSDLSSVISTNISATNIEYKGANHVISFTAPDSNDVFKEGATATLSFTLQYADGGNVVITSDDRSISNSHSAKDAPYVCIYYEDYLIWGTAPSEPLSDSDFAPVVTKLSYTTESKAIPSNWGQQFNFNDWYEKFWNMGSYRYFGPGSIYNLSQSQQYTVYVEVTNNGGNTQYEEVSIKLYHIQPDSGMTCTLLMAAYKESGDDSQAQGFANSEVSIVNAEVTGYDSATDCTTITFDTSESFAKGEILCLTLKYKYTSQSNSNKPGGQNNQGGQSNPNGQGGQGNPDGQGGQNNQGGTSGEQNSQNSYYSNSRESFAYSHFLKGEEYVCVYQKTKNDTQSLKWGKEPEKETTEIKPVITARNDRSSEKGRYNISFTVENLGTDLEWDKMEIRYYYVSPEGAGDLGISSSSGWETHWGKSNTNLNCSVQSYTPATSDADHYISIKLSDPKCHYFTSGESRQVSLTVGFKKQGGSQYGGPDGQYDIFDDQTTGFKVAAFLNSFSYYDINDSADDNNKKIAIYYDGELVWGEEPSANKKTITVCAKDDSENVISGTFEFGIYKDSDCTNLVTTLTGNNVTSSALFEVGKTYYVKLNSDNTAEKNYNLTSAVTKEITIGESENTVTFSFVKPQPASLLIEAVRMDGETKTPVSGVYEFELYTDENCTQKKTSITVSNASSGTISELYTGETYWLKVKSVAAGYGVSKVGETEIGENDKNIGKVVITNAGENTVTVTLEMMNLKLEVPVVWYAPYSDNESLTFRIVNNSDQYIDVSKIQLRLYCYYDYDYFVKQHYQGEIGVNFYNTTTAEPCTDIYHYENFGYVKQGNKSYDLSLSPVKSGFNTASAQTYLSLTPKVNGDAQDLLKPQGMIKFKFTYSYRDNTPAEYRTIAQSWFLRDVTRFNDKVGGAYVVVYYDGVYVSGIEPTE